MQVFPKERLKNRYGDQGMTLVEVLLVLVLLVVVLVPAVNAIATTNRIWLHNKAINPSINQANISMTWISREIRRAAQPSKAVDAVLVEDGGQRLVIYHYNETTSEWEKIVYQINADHQLKRVILSESDPADIISAAIPDETDSGWATLLEGVTSNPAFNRPANSREVEVNLQVSDSGQVNPRFAPFDLASTYMIRSREVGAITGDPVPDETEPLVVDVQKVDINIEKNILGNKVIALNDKDKKTANISATIWPANATNKSATWSSSSNSNLVAVTFDPNDSLNAHLEVVGTVPWYDTPQNVNVTVTAEGTSDSCIVRVSHKV